MKTASLARHSFRCGTAHRPADRALVRTILVPTDFSKSAKKALLYAIAVGKKFRAAVHLLHVNDMLVEQPMLAPLFSLDTEIGHKLRRRLQKIAADCETRIAPARCHIREGKAFDHINRQARLLNADLIVISTRGHTGVKHVILGSTVERVVRHARTPVLVVREHEREFVERDAVGKPAFRLQRILVPIDFSDYSAQALRYIVGWAKRFGARLLLRHAIYPHYYATNSAYTAFDLPQLIESLRVAAEREMRKLVTATAFRGVPFETRIVLGSPAMEMTDSAAANQVDLIAIATHGRTGLKRALIGSVAEAIVRHAPCPVLVLPHNVLCK